MNSRKPSHDSLRLFRLFRTGSAPGGSVCFPMRWSTTLRELFQSLPEIGSAGNPHTCTARITLAVTPVMRKSPYAGMIFNGLGRPLNLDGVSATLPASMGGNKTPIMDEALLRDPSAKTGSGNITADCGRGSDFRQRRLHNEAECGKCKNHGVSCL